MRLTIWYCVAASICVASAGLTMSGEAAEGEWTALDRRGFNAIRALRTTGDLFISNGKTVHVSRDHGETWTEPVEKQKRGRHYNSIAMDADWRGERLAVFPIDSPVGWITLDGGRTWDTFAKPKPPQVNKHDGWTLGAVDWSQEKPTRFFAKEHHSGNFWFSRDAGGTWRRLEGFGGYFGTGFGADGALLVGAFEGKKAHMPGDKPGIYRSTDDGASWELVFECKLHQKVAPQRFGETLFWPTVEGLAVSRDGGKTWALLKDTPKDVLFGPFFGKTQEHMVVVTEEGVHESADGCKSWDLIVPRADLPKVVRDANFAGLRPNFAWEPQADILYATSMGVGLFRRQL
jgi:hypothetical protein